jgi:hypothetical protein
MISEVDIKDWKYTNESTAHSLGHDSGYQSGTQVERERGAGQFGTVFVHELVNKFVNTNQGLRKLWGTGNLQR